MIAALLSQGETLCNDYKEGGDVFSDGGFHFANETVTPKYRSFANLEHSPATTRINSKTLLMYCKLKTFKSP